MPDSLTQILYHGTMYEWSGTPTLNCCSENCIYCGCVYFKCMYSHWKYFTGCYDQNWSYEWLQISPKWYQLTIIIRKNNNLHMTNRYPLIWFIKRPRCKFFVNLPLTFVVVLHLLLIEIYCTSHFMDETAEQYQCSIEISRYQ